MTDKSVLEAKLDDLVKSLNNFRNSNMSDDWKEEARIEKIVESAVSFADRILLDFSSGDKEELDYMTSAVALKFMEKVITQTRQAIFRKRFNDTHIRVP